MAFGVGFLVALIVNAHYSEQGAAWGQLPRLIIFTISIFLVSKHLFGSVANFVWDPPRPFASRFLCLYNKLDQLNDVPPLLMCFDSACVPVGCRPFPVKWILEYR
jgi:hypothetical protein